MLLKSRLLFEDSVGRLKSESGEMTFAQIRELVTRDIRNSNLKSENNKFGSCASDSADSG